MATGVRGSAASVFTPAQEALAELDSQEVEAMLCALEDAAEVPDVQQMMDALGEVAMRVLGKREAQRVLASVL